MKSKAFKEVFTSLRFPASLRFRLTAMVFIISVFVIVIAIMYINDRAVVIIERNSNEQLNTVSRTLSATVSVWLDSHLNALQNLASIPDIMSMDAQKQKPLLKKMAAAYPYLYLISTTDLNGMNVARNDDIGPKDYSNREWFQKARQGAAVTFESLIGKTSNKPALVVAMPIHDEAGRIVGVGMFATVLEKLSHQVRATQVGKTGFAYIVDSCNRVIAHPNAAYAHRLLDFGNYPPVKALRNGLQGTLVFNDDSGRHWRACVNKLDNGWGIVVQQQEDELLNTQRMFQHVAFAIILTAVLILLSTTWWVVKWALHPIEDLTKAVRKTSFDNHNLPDFKYIRRASLDIKTRDEVGTLAEGFNEMTVRLESTLVSLEQELSERKHAEEELKKHRDQLEDLIRERTIELIDSNECLKQEIEERKLAEDALRKSEEHYRTIFENTGTASMLLGEDKTVLMVNTNFERLSGYSRQEVEGKMKWTVFVSQESVEKMKKYHDMRRQIPGSAPSSYEFRFINRQGDIRDIFLSIALISGTKVSVASLMDITDWKSAEAARKELEEKLSRAQKMEALGLLAGGVAHDLNNVLSGIVSYPDLILMEMAEDNPLRKRIMTIRDSGNKAAAIVQDLLTLARRGVIHTCVVDMNEEIIKTYLNSPEHMNILSSYPNIMIEMSLDPGRLKIKGSPVHLKKTLMNLIINSLEAQPEGGRIRVSTTNTYVDKPIEGYDKISEGDYVVLKVEDDGVGINKDDIKRIFEPFYTKKVMGRSGTGLGMAVVWGTVQDHNGYINVHSTPGKGSCFELYFPVTREEYTPEKSAIPVADYMGHGEDILVVDDVIEQREIASSILLKLNYNVVTAASGEEAVEYLQSYSFDLLLLDMIMDPGMDGLDTYKKVTEIHPGQKAIIASGFAENERVREAQTLGVSRYIKKPYTIEKLGVAIKEELSH